MLSFSPFCFIYPPSLGLCTLSFVFPVIIYLTSSCIQGKLQHVW
jgi:hypothetical protein